MTATVICMDSLKIYLLSLHEGSLPTQQIINPLSWLEFETENIMCAVEKRPPYCDRGRYIWKADSKDNTILNIDNADMFPRYFFNIEALIMEIESWLIARKETTLIAIEIKDISSLEESSGDE